MPAQTSLADVDHGDYIEHVYSFDNGTTRSVLEVKAGVRSQDADVLFPKLIEADKQWATLTAAQKDKLLRLLCRYVLGRFDGT